MKQRSAKRSIKTRLITIFVITSMIPILIVNMLSYQNTSRLVRENISAMTQNLLQQTRVSLDVWMDSYEDILFWAYTDDEIVELVDRLNAGEDVANNRRLLRKTLRGMFYMKDYIKAITVITDNGELVFYDMLTASTTYTSWMDSMYASKEELYEEISVDNRTHLLRTGKEITFGRESYNLFHMGHRIIDYRDVNKRSGIVIVSIDERLLQEICASTEKQRQGNKNTLNLIVDREGYVISCADSEETGTKLFSNKAEEKERETAIKELARRTGLSEKGEIDVYILSDEKSGWEIVCVSDQEELLSSLNKQQRLLISMTLFFLLAVLFIMIWQVNQMTGSIQKVVCAMRKAGRGDLTVHVGPDRTRTAEIETIAEEFNMTMDKLKWSTERQKNAEITALEAQINPHFLYNTLDMINWMAIDREEYEISNTVSALAQILRYGITNSNQTVTLKEEADWLKKYIFLQQTRLKNCFECRIDLEPDLLEFPVHKMLLQPFVENAIRHGFEGIDRNCCLQVDIRRMNSGIEVTVKDNGCGMAEDMVRKINRGFFEKSGEKAHIGMENAITRLKMYYGDGAKVVVESEEGQGTAVHIFIPEPEGGTEDDASDR